jgi:hypothetical protein
MRELAVEDKLTNVEIIKKTVPPEIANEHMSIEIKPCHTMVRSFIPCLRCGDVMFLYANGWHCFSCGAWLPQSFVVEEKA